MNCSAQSYSIRSTVNGEGVHWEKGEGGCQNKTTSSLIHVSDAKQQSILILQENARKEILQNHFYP